MLTAQWTEGHFRVQRPKWKEGNKDVVACVVTSSVSVRCTRSSVVLHIMRYIYTTVDNIATRHLKLQAVWDLYADHGTCAL